MKPAHLLFPAALLWLVACGDSKAASTDSNVAGTYVIDIDAFRAEMQKQMPEVPAEQKQMAEAAMKPMLDGLSKAEIKLAADHTWTGTSDTNGKPEVSEGTWKLNGNEVTMTTTKKGGAPDSETRTGTWKDGKIYVTEKQGEHTMTMVLKKK